MKKLLSILCAVGLTATASSAVVSCAHTFNGHFRAYDVTLSANNKTSMKWWKDGKVHDSYLKKDDIIKALSDVAVKEAYSWIVQDFLVKEQGIKVDGTKSTSEMRNQLIELADKELIEYDATKGMKITKENEHDPLTKVFTSPDKEVDWPNIIPNGTTYQIGLRNANGSDGGMTKDAKGNFTGHWLWINLKFEK